MTEPIAWLDGRDVPLSEARLSIFDLGVVQGATVTEMIRTFGHMPFRLDDHLARLEHSLAGVGIETGLEWADWRAPIERLVAHNAALLPVGQDLGITLFVTAGWNRAYLAPGERERAGRPTVCLHTYPLAFELWAHRYERGQHLVIPRIRQVPAETLDPTIKMRSRLHWYLADREAREADPEAQALLLDGNGLLTETSTGNLCLVRQGTILTPPAGRVLAGVSLDVVRELATELGIEVVERDLTADEAYSADEIWTTSTPYCVLPVTRLDGRVVGAGAPGPLYKKLLEAWNGLVGLDIMTQSLAGARERLDHDPSTVP